MSNFRNIPLPPRLIFGRGALQQLDEVLNPQRKNTDSPFVFIVDHCFKNNKDLTNSLPLSKNDLILFADTTHEPKTKQVDSIRDRLKSAFGDNISGVIGVGGGSVMDIAKAVALMLTNKGSSTNYQGWDLIQNPALYKVGIPTLAGTGAEVSQTCVLMGSKRKLGIYSDYTPFDQIILSPDLMNSVTQEQRFYSGMDCYIHCIESLEGSYINAFSKSHGEKALTLCRDVFLECNEWQPECDEKIMMASYLGGISIATSQVGMVHALSYGLSYLLGIKHGEGNCLVVNLIEQYYPEGYAEFQQMLEKNNIVLRKNICKDLRNKDFEMMSKVALGLEPLWENTLGKDWREAINAEKINEIYQQI
jgi:3-deoxy-alpha-D-manno-octulosonate 8-oxidase